MSPKLPVIALAVGLMAPLVAGPALAAPYRLDRLHDRENRIQDAVDRQKMGPAAGRALTRVRELEQKMRADHGSNLTRRDFAILNAHLYAIEHPGARRAMHRRMAAGEGAGSGGASVTTVQRTAPGASTTTVQHPAPGVTTTTTTTVKR